MAPLANTLPAWKWCLQRSPHIICCISITGGGSGAPVVLVIAPAVAIVSLSDMSSYINHAKYNNRNRNVCCCCGFWWPSL